jgi:O-antigen ligase
MKSKNKISVFARVASWLLFAAVALAPLPFGSNEPTAIAFWCVVLGACVLLAPIRSLGVGEFALAAFALLIIAAYAFVLHEQLAEHPWSAAAIPDPIWYEAASALGIPLQPSVSLARNQPWFELGRPLVCLLAIVGGFLIGNFRGRTLIKIIGWSGAAYAAYGILAHLIDPTRLLWREKDAYLGSVTGTFVNRNTAAAYFGSCAVIWSLLLWERVRLEMPPGPIEWQKMPSRLLHATPKKIAVAFVMLFVCLAAMFMTGSRGGVVLSLLALLVAFTVFFRRDLPRLSGIVTALAAGGATALILLQLLGGGVNARFDLQGTADEGRLETYKSALRIIADHPWFGTGQGTFAYALPAYRSDQVSMWGVWDLAHNTLLEIASDMGVPIAVLVVIGWIVIFAVLIHGVRSPRRDLIIPVAALAIGILAVLHSLIDFSLQIPGYSIVVLSLIGAGLAQSFGDRTKKAKTVAAGELDPPAGVFDEMQPVTERGASLPKAPSL